MEPNSPLNTQSNSQKSPNELFTIEQFALPSSIINILSIGVSKLYLLLTTSTNEVYRYFIGRRETLQQSYPFPKQRQKDREGKVIIDKFNKNSFSSSVFCEPLGNHSLLRHFGLMYYFNARSSKVKELITLKDVSVTAVAWDERNSTPSSTGSILISDDNNSTIYEYRIDIDSDNNIKDKLVPLIRIEDSIHGLFFYNKEFQKEPLRYVLAVTNNKLYQFTGVPFFKDLFKKYADDPYVFESAIKSFPSAIQLRKAPIQLLFNAEEKPVSFGWKSACGFCNGDFTDDSEVVTKFMMIPYEKVNHAEEKEKDDNPIASAYTPYHIFFLFTDCLTIISRITYNIIQTIPLKETFIDLQYDRYANCLWMVSSSNLHQVSLEEEDKNVWQDYLEKEEYKSASDYCKQKKPQFAKRVSRMTANSLFAKQDYLNAAIHYAESEEKFEEVGLKFLVNEQHEALLTYLFMISEKRLQSSDKTQLCLILTWIVEIYLHKLTMLKSPEEVSAKSSELINFMRDKEAFLDKDTVYQLLQQYSRVDEFLAFAEVKKDYETVILHYINDKRINEAIGKMQEFASASSEEKVSDISHIFTRYIHIFLKYNVEATVSLLKEQKTRIRIERTKLVSAMMNIDTEHREKVIPYLQHLISDARAEDRNVHNLYLFFLANLGETYRNELLVDYLKKHLIKQQENNGSLIPFDTEYALQVFGNAKHHQAQAYVLAMMTKYSEAIKLCLEHNEVETAKFIAKTMKDAKMKRCLWLDIFKHQIALPGQSNQEEKKEGGNKDCHPNLSFQKSLDIMKESEVLKIEEILPCIVNNIRIEEFKEQISNCISSYEKTIQQLKKEVTAYNDTAENLKGDISQLEKKAIEIKYRHSTCDICNCPIKASNVYLFPCGHMFDSNCLVEALNDYAKYFDAAKRKKAKIAELKSMIAAIGKRKENSEGNKKESNLLTDIMGLITDKEQRNEKSVVPSDSSGMLEECTMKLNGLLLEECVLCGNMVIESTQMGFKGDKTVWDSL